MRLASGLFLVGCFALAGSAQPPEDLDPRIELAQSGVRLTLVAEHPSIVTPTGIDVDDQGRIWAVASHTHFRPDDYEGPAHDQVLVFAQPLDAKPRVFFDQTDATMDLELGSDGWVYLAERDRILRVRDRDGDGVGDQVEDLAVLHTEADYPHNGLSGLAWHPSGDLIFALGENFQSEWKLTGVDGRTDEGTGEGGIFRCRPDGTELRRIARGFWNPFGVCVRADGTMFAAENDPGARPPCRLLQVLEGGDYGYQRLYGNAPYHPFVCWDGELRGTLPMLHPVGEAPCGIAPLGNGLMVPSWTEHRIDFYPLTAKGAGFETHRVTLVSGGQHFRPTCITQASPTVYYLTDWVFGSYELHRRGRIWKLEIDPAAPWLGELELVPPTAEAQLATGLMDGTSQPALSSLLQMAKQADPYLRHAAISALAARSDSIDEATVRQWSTSDQISALLARRRSQPKNVEWVRFFWQVDDPEIRFETLRWIADERLVAFLRDVESLLEQKSSDAQWDDYRLFEAALATWNTLSGDPQAGVADAEMLMTRVRDRDASSRTRAFALRLLDPNHKDFTEEVWHTLLQTDDPLVRSELVRAVASSERPAASGFLASIASDPSQTMADRADAVAGLAGGGQSVHDLLLRLAAADDRSLREEALRSLRFTSVDDRARRSLQGIAERYPKSADLVQAVLDPNVVKRDRPELSDLNAWRSRLESVETPVDLAAGRRIFHHASVGTCAKCHRHGGRGNVLGPDLTAASNVGDPERLLRALLQPSRDIDPQYYPRMLVTEDGHVFTGLLLRDGGGGKEVYRDNLGREQVFDTEKIVERKELTTSMMPEGLIDLMTDREIRDLIAFLDSRRDEEPIRRR